MLLAFDADYLCLWIDEHFSNGVADSDDFYGNQFYFLGQFRKNLGWHCVFAKPHILCLKSVKLDNHYVV